MKLTRVTIKDYRSFSGTHEIVLGGGVNYFVGPNNSGKSNLMNAIALALDPDATYSAVRDRPAREQNSGQPPLTRITLEFSLGSSGPEVTLRKKAEAYERLVARGSSTYAAEDQLRFVATFRSNGGRTETFLAKGAGAQTAQADSKEYQDLHAQFRRVIRFVSLHSGEDLESVLAGRFREILHLVIRDHLSAEVGKSEQARSEYTRALQAELLDPLRAHITDSLSTMFSEVRMADLVPRIPNIADSLSSIDVQVTDAAITGLDSKGTGLRGVVLVAMLRYLAEQSRRSLIFAVEEPEAFLHPAAQESVMSELENLASRVDVTLMVTTHSPHVISRRPDAVIFEVGKDAGGRSSIPRRAAGDDQRAPLLEALYGDQNLGRILDRLGELPRDSRAVLVTEGYTDGIYLRAAARVSGRAELLEGVHIIPAGSAVKAAVEGIASTAVHGDIPVLVLLDDDEIGNATRDKLKSFNWDPRKGLLSVSSPGRPCDRPSCQAPIEIEDLIPDSTWTRMLKGSRSMIDVDTKCGNTRHYQLSAEGKKKALQWVPLNLTAKEASGLIALLEEINIRIDSIEQDLARRRRASAL
jgi:putative ATP-dependent endonuclease of OLD family